MANESYAIAENPDNGGKGLQSLNNYPAFDKQGNLPINSINEIELIQKTIELTETKALLEDKNYELLKLNREITMQNKELIEKTIELTETKALLEDKNVALEDANKEILNTLNLKTIFISQAAHDLKTPLTPVMILLPLLRKGITDKHLLHNLDIVEKNANYLNHIVNELIAFIKLQTSKIENVFEDTNLIKLVNEVIINNEIVFKTHRIRIIKKFAKNIPDTLADKFNMRAVFQNLLSNAIKFTHNNGSITITIRKIDNFINVRISDTGIGMSKKTISKLFTEFFRADESRHIEGTGLGLSICKRIIENHKGRILAESRGNNNGSSIIFEIPIKTEMEK